MNAFLDPAPGTRRRGYVGVPLAVLPHVIGGKSGIWDEILASVGVVLIPVLAYVLFRLGRWARRNEQTKEQKPPQQD